MVPFFSPVNFRYVLVYPMKSAHRDRREGGREGGGKRRGITQTMRDDSNVDCTCLPACPCRCGGGGVVSVCVCMCVCVCTIIADIEVPHFDINHQLPLPQL